MLFIWIALKSADPSVSWQEARPAKLSGGWQRLGWRSMHSNLESVPRALDVNLLGRLKDAFHSHLVQTQYWCKCHWHIAEKCSEEGRKRVFLDRITTIVRSAWWSVSGRAAANLRCETCLSWYHYISVLFTRGNATTMTLIIRQSLRHMQFLLLSHKW